MQKTNNFYGYFKGILNDFVDQVYLVTRNFPRDEIFGITSQLRRAALSVVLNYIEGYARQSKPLVMRNFIEIAYGSIKESEYLISFSYKQRFLEKDSYEKLLGLTNKIGGILWGILHRISSQ